MGYGAQLLDAIANPKPIQVKTPVELASQGLQLANAAQSLKTAQTQQADVEQQIEQRRIANAKQEQIHNVLQGATWDHDKQSIDENTLSAIDKIDPAIGANLRKSYGEINKQTQDIAKSKADVENERAKLVPEDERKFQAFYPGYLEANGLQKNAFNEMKARSAYATVGKEADIREKNAQAGKLESEAGALPQDAASAAAQIDAIAPPADKALGDTNKRYKAELSAGTYSPARGADIVKRASEEAKSISVAKNTVPFKVEVQNAGASQATGAGLDLMAEQALNGSFTSRNPVLLSKVYQRAADMAKERGLTSTGVIMAQNAAKASRQALDTLTNQMTQVEAFSQTAAKNMTTLEKAMGGVTDLGAPFLNTPIRNLQQKYAGNPKVTAFYAALQPVQTEIAKILNSSNASGVLTDNARNEMQTALGPGATPAQLKAALDIFRQDIENRRTTYKAMQQDVLGQTVVGGGKTSDPLGIR